VYITTGNHDVKWPHPIGGFRCELAMMLVKQLNPPMGSRLFMKDDDEGIMMVILMDAIIF